MKNPISTLFILLVCFSAFGQKTRVINNPSFEFTNSGIYEVSKIELSSTETRLHIHSVFIPKWWVKYSEKDCIYLHETGDTLSPTTIIGTEFGKKLWMPASGDSTIIMVYPPVAKKVKTIDWFTLDDQQNIYGISLDPNKKQTEIDKTIPQSVEDWFEKELNAQEKNAPMKIADGDLFKEGDAKVIGYIKGYEKRAGFSTGIVYMSNVFTREDFPTVITIYPDGRFETTLPLIHPIRSSLFINNEWIPFYAEPKQTTCLILNWDEFLLADRQRNIRYKFKNVEYRGPLAKINSELFQFNDEPWDYKTILKKIRRTSPEDYLSFEEEWKTKSLDKLNSYKEEQNISKSAYKILNNDIYLSYGTHIFSFPRTQAYEAKKDSSNSFLTMPIPENYFSFLQNIPLNDPAIVINSEFKTFINRFEYMSPISYRAIAKYKLNYKKLSGYQLLKANNVSLKDEEWQLLELASKKDKTEQELEFTKQNTEKVNLIYKNYQHIFQKQFEIQRAMATKSEWLKKDSLIDVTVQTNAQFAKDVIKVRSLNSYCKKLDSEAAHIMWNELKPLIINPSVTSQGDQLLSRMFPKEKAEYFALAEGKGKEIFTNIIAPFKGKVLFIDFWATSCGPCVSGIKRMKATREKYKDNPNIEFIFITDERSSPKTTYDTFIAEQELKNTFRISKDDYFYLRELFQFNGIPRYALVDKDGNVLDNDFSMYNFKSELKKRFPEFVIED